MSTLKQFVKRNSHNIIFKPLAGFGRALNRFYENRNHDSFSNGELTVLKKISKFSPAIIIDGGSNTGEYSLMINKTSPNCRVFAFEPVKSTYNVLVNNTSHIKVITPVNKGLFKAECRMQINVFPADQHSSIYDIEGLAYNVNNREEIELVSGDRFIEENNIKSIDLLKLDVEGAEYDALLGFENAFKKGIIKAVQFEYGYINITTKKLLIDYYHFFEQYGFMVGKIFPKQVEFRKYNFVFEDFLGPNFIAVRKNEEELIRRLESK